MSEMKLALFRRKSSGVVVEGGSGFCSGSGSGSLSPANVDLMESKSSFVDA